MKKQIYYVLFISTIFINIIAMDTTHEYHVTDLQQLIIQKKELTQQYMAAKNKLEKAKENYKPEQVFSQKKFNKVQKAQRSYYDILTQHREVQNSYKKHCDNIAKMIKNISEKVEINYKEFYHDPQLLSNYLYTQEQLNQMNLYEKLNQLNKERINWNSPQAKEDRLCINAGTVKHVNPKTNQEESFADDSYSPYYKKASIVNSKKRIFTTPQKSSQASEAIGYYNALENAAYHDALHNLQKLQHFMEYKWNQKSWWYRFWYSKSYKNQMSELQKEIEFFKQNRNLFTKSNLHKNAYHDLFTCSFRIYN